MCNISLSTGQAPLTCLQTEVQTVLLQTFPVSSAGKHFQFLRHSLPWTDLPFLTCQHPLSKSETQNNYHVPVFNCQRVSLYNCQTFRNYWECPELSHLCLSAGDYTKVMKQAEECLISKNTYIQKRQVLSALFRSSLRHPSLAHLRQGLTQTVPALGLQQTAQLLKTRQYSLSIMLYPCADCLANSYLQKTWYLLSLLQNVSHCVAEKGYLSLEQKNKAFLVDIQD